MRYYELANICTINIYTMGVCYTSTNQITKVVDPKTYLIFSCLISGFMFLGWSMYENSIENDSAKIISVLHWILISTFSSFFACYFSVMAVKSGGAVNAALIEISYPFWVIVFTSLLAGKININPLSVIGGLVIFIGTALVLRGNNGN